MSNYKILVKPLKSIAEMPRLMKGTSFKIEDEKLLCLEQHFYRMDMLPLHYAIAGLDMDSNQAEQHFLNEGFDINEAWVIVMECKIMK